MNWKTYTYGLLLFNLFGFITFIPLTDIPVLPAAEHCKNYQMFRGIWHSIQQ